MLLTEVLMVQSEILSNNSNRTMDIAYCLKQNLNGVNLKRKQEISYIAGYTQ